MESAEYDKSIINRLSRRCLQGAINLPKPEASEVQQMVFFPGQLFFLQAEESEERPVIEQLHTRGVIGGVWVWGLGAPGWMTSYRCCPKDSLYRKWAQMQPIFGVLDVYILNLSKTQSDVLLFP